MVKIRRGWYLLDIKKDEEEKIKNEKEAALEERRASMVKRCDNKIGRRRCSTQIEQREIISAEKSLCVKPAIKAKQEEIELTHRLAAELSRRKNEEIKHALKSDRVKSSIQSLPICTLQEARSHLIEEKVRLEANQAKLLKRWHEDKTIEKLKQIENERKKQISREKLQNQLADNRRRIQQRLIEEKEQDREMMERAIQKIQEEDAEIRKRKKKEATFLKTEIAASLAAKKVWEKKYKKMLKDEDERITRIFTEKTQQEKLNRKMEFCMAKEIAIDKAAKKLLTDVCKEKKQKIADELYWLEKRSKWTTELIKSTKKQCAEPFQEIEKKKVERKTEDEAIDASARYLDEERKKNIERQKKSNNARRARKIQYGKELKETMIKNRIAYAMDILEQQPESHIYDKNTNETNIKHMN